MAQALYQAFDQRLDYFIEVLWNRGLIYPTPHADVKNACVQRPYQFHLEIDVIVGRIRRETEFMPRLVNHCLENTFMQQLEEAVIDALLAQTSKDQDTDPFVANQVLRIVQVIALQPLF